MMFALGGANAITIFIPEHHVKSDFLCEISLGLSPQDPFSEEEGMEVVILATQEGSVLPQSPSEQALEDLITDQCPSQVPEDTLLGAPPAGPGPQ